MLKRVVGQYGFSGPILTCMNFATGAARAAAWVAGRPAGLYTMADVLGDD